MTPTNETALISWCVSLSQEFEFDSETTHLAVNYLDRYLSTMRVAHVSKHYLLATACVYLASKFGEEIKEPCISDVSVCSMFGSSVKDIKRMEAKVLKELKWELMPVTPQALLSELMESVGETVFPEELKSKLVEECQVYFSLALSRTEFLKFQPAILVFSAVQLVVPVAFQRLDLESPGLTAQSLGHSVY
ncbi:cyclin-like protein [Chytriomyces sp. MP71]|nr:cyclin-like protein [Chytriomyces sp. MP71]